MAKRVVYLAYTVSDQLHSKELLCIYSKSSYQTAYNWLADIAERHGFKVLPSVTSPEVVAQVHNPAHGQVWWLERHDVE